MTWEELRQRIDDMDEAALQELVLISVWSGEVYISSSVSDDATQPMLQVEEEDQEIDATFYFGT